MNGTRVCDLCGHRPFCPVFLIQRSATPLGTQAASLCSGTRRNPK